jgi:hypothetical protein
LLVNEVGTGGTLVAFLVHYLHLLQLRRQKEASDGGSLPEGILEQIFNGHQKSMGALTEM